MNILVISREIPPVGGGAGQVALNLARRSERLGHGVHIVTMSFKGLPALEQRGNMHIHRLACFRRNQDSSYILEMAVFVLRAVPLARKLVKDAGISLIHAHAIIPDGLIALLAARSRVPVAATAHGSDVPGYNTDKFQVAHTFVAPIWNRALDGMDVLTAPSRHMADLIRKKKPEQDITVIPNGIDLDIFPETSPADKNRHFLIVSRLVQRKNYHLFLQALHDVLEPQTVHIVGTGPMLGELRQIAATMPRHAILFHGWLKNGDPEWTRLYVQSRFFVFPSASENFPMNLLEAMLARMVVIASDIPGNREVLGDEALYLRSLDKESLSQALQAVLNMSEAGLDALANRARARVQRLFSWDAIGARYDAVFDSALQARKGSPGKP